MALAVANANPPPEVGLPFRKLPGMMWARWGGGGRNGHGTALNKEVLPAPPSWNCAVPWRGWECKGRWWCSPATPITQVNMKRLCHKPPAVCALSHQQLPRGWKGPAGMCFSSLKDPHQLRKHRPPLQSPSKGGQLIAKCGPGGLDLRPGLWEKVVQGKGAKERRGTPKLGTAMG